MRTSYITLLLAVLLSSCKTEPATTEISGFKWPEGLDGCKAYILVNDDNDRLRVIRCPGKNITTTNYEERVGKVTHYYTVVTIDGTEYVPAPSKDPVNNTVGNNTPPEPPASAVINGVEYVRKKSQ